MRKLQNTYTRANTKIVANIGDSLSYNIGFSSPEPYQFWAKQLETSLRGLGCNVISINGGISGNTTTQMVTRKAMLTSQGVPSLGIVFGGVNDPGNSITGTTTQSNLTTLIQTILNAGCDKVLVLNTQYLNYSTGGDTVDMPYATYSTLRGFQLEAVSSFATSNPGQVVLVDLYAYMKSLIVNGTETQGSFSWHVADSNQHLNLLGNTYVHDIVLQTIQDQDGWIADLQR